MPYKRIRASNAVRGHSGIDATYKHIKRMFAWSGLKVADTYFVHLCEVCQHAKHLNCRPAELIQPFPILKGAWRDIKMDFIEGLPLCDGYNVILVIVDRFTKYTHCIPLGHPYIAQQVAHVFVKLHGMSLTIILDCNCIFTSNF